MSHQLEIERAGGDMTKATVPALRAETADMTALGSLPLLQGEKRADYERLRAAVIAEMKPADLMEKIWTDDIIYLQWEIIRFRRAKGNYLRHLASPDLCSGFNLKLDEKGSHMDLAKGVAKNIHTLEQLERTIALMEQRRNAAYYQAEEHRANLGNRFRQAITQVEDAEFRELDDQPTGQRGAA
jgi:hypothetical protein